MMTQPNPLLAAAEAQAGDVAVSIANPMRGVRALPGPFAENNLRQGSNTSTIADPANQSPAVLDSDPGIRNGSSGSSGNPCVSTPSTDNVATLG